MNKFKKQEYLNREFSKEIYREHREQIKMRSCPTSTVLGNRWKQY